MFEGLRRTLSIAKLASEAEKSGVPVDITINGPNCPLVVGVRGSRFMSVGEDTNGPDLVIQAAKHELANGGGRSYPVTHIVK